MFRIIVIAAALVCCLDAAPRALRRPDLRRGSRIVGGTDADIKDFPYHVSYQYLFCHWCGASIISEDWAITAAHCSDGLSANEVSILAGSSILDEGGDMYLVAEIIMNENFDWYTFDNDICLVKVTTKFRLGEGVAIIPLATVSPAAGTIVTISGWGATTQWGHYNKQLQQVQVPVIDHNECSKIYSQYGGVTDSMLCAGLLAGGKDACLGDAGGPYVANGTLVGLVSWDVACGQENYPGVAADVANFRKWITEKTGI